MSHRSQRFLLILVYLFLITAVSIFTNTDQSQAQTNRPSRANIENTPHFPQINSQQNIINSESGAPIPQLPWSRVVVQRYENNEWRIYFSNDNGLEKQFIDTGVYPQLNRGNTQLAYSRLVGSTYEIYKKSIPNGDRIRLTNNGSHDARPVWSPNGERIAFESYRDGQAEIYVMDKNGNYQTRLTSHSEFDGMPTWSPDGSQLAFVSSRTGGYRIWVMNADGSNLRQLSTKAYSFRPKWSPDGSKIAFDADQNQDGWQNLWAINIDGSSETLLIDPNGATDTWTSSWSPDGSFIAYTQINFVQYQGNWYWEHAYQHAIKPSNNYVLRLTYNNHDTDWYPHWQTQDALPPASSIQAISLESSAPIHLSWPGSDLGGSGINHYDVQVKEGLSGGWTNWLTDTPSSSANYPGIGGTTYFFRVRARDNAHNQEIFPNVYDVTTRVEAYPPVAEFAPLPPFSRYDKPLVISWLGYDPGQSGIRSYDIDHRIDGGSWTRWQDETAEDSAIVENPAPEELFEFRVRATDNAENASTWLTDSNAQTQIYRWGILGTTYDNTGTPVSAVLPTSATIMGSQTSDQEGIFAAYLSDDHPMYTVNWQSDKYIDLPDTQYPQAEDNYQSMFMPPVDNSISNWGFEDGTNGWQFSGNIPGLITDTLYHTGNQSAFLGNSPQIMPNKLVPITNQLLLFQYKQDAQGIGHLVVLNKELSSTKLFYRQLHLDNTWSVEEIIAPITQDISRLNVLVSDEGHVFAFWLGINSNSDPVAGNTIFYSMRDLNGVWNSPETIIGLNSPFPFQVARSANNQLHVLSQKWEPANNYEIFYTYRDSDGWSDPVQISNPTQSPRSHAFTSEATLTSSADGNIHVTWVEKPELSNNKIYYKERLATGVWLPSLEIANVEELYPHIGAVVDQQGHVHLVWKDDPNGKPMQLYYAERLANKQWQPSIIINQNIEAENPHIAVSPAGSVHVAWSGRGVYHTWRDENDIWHYPQNYGQNTVWSDFYDRSYYLQMELDDTGLAHLSWYEVIDSDIWSYELYYARQRVNNQIVVEKITEGAEGIFGAFSPLKLAVKDTSSPHILWQVDETLPVNYRTPATTTVSGNSEMSTAVNIPNSMANPTLSFVYELAGGVGESDEMLTVQIDDGSQLTTVYSTGDATPWKHHWIDMTPWAGETVTVRFTLNETANTPNSSVIIDEVTVGSRYQDLQVSIGDGFAAKTEQGTVVIEYENRGHVLAENVQLQLTLPTGLKFAGSDISPTQSSPQIVWNLGDIPPDSGPQIIEVEIEVLSSAPSFVNLQTSVSISADSDELELLNNSGEGSFFTGNFIYLPVINR